jgi:hypothetical protein
VPFGRRIIHIIVKNKMDGTMITIGVAKEGSGGGLRRRRGVVIVHGNAAAVLYDAGLLRE